MSITAAVRQLRRRPGFSVTIIVMLALGIGATTGILTLFHGVVLRTLPVLEPERLVNLAAPGPKLGATSCNDAGGCEEIFSYQMFRDLEARQSAFAGIAAHREFDANISYDDRSLAASGMLVSGRYFPLLGLQPALGRLIGVQDESRADESLVAVLSHEHWRNQFGADPGVIGKTLSVNGQRLTVIGVAPEKFTGTTVGNRPQVFVPISLRWIMQPTVGRDAEDRRSYWVYLFARLKPGASLEESAAGINTLYTAILNEVEAPLNADMTPDQLAQFRQRQITLTPGARGQSAIAASAESPLALLLGVTVLVLLIVCVNIANLMLVRGASRAGEMAIRASLGASRPQLAAQLVAEAALLALLGGVASVPVARAVLDITVAAFPETLAYGLNVEWSALALFATASASLATLMIFGTVPALEAMRANPGAVMKGQSSQSVGGRAAPFRNFLAMIQIAFAMALLVLAGLFTQSLFNIARVELGVGVDSLVTFTVAPRLSGYTQQQTSDFFDRIEAELAAQPGVLGVAASRVLLFDDRQWTGRVGTLDGREVQAGGIISLNAVSPGFFRTVSIPLLGGRDLAHSDIETSPRVAVANESFLRRFNLGVDAVGKSFTFGDPNRPVTIVGIVADARYSNIKNEIPPQVFLSRHQFTNLDAVSFYVRGAVTEGALLDSVPRAVAAVDRTLPVRRLMTMRAHVDDNVYLDRLVTLLSAAFAVLATLLAAIGLYGVLAYNVSQRTRELGLRLALGATPTALRAMVLRNVVRIALVGLPIGLAVALAAGRAAEALLYGLSGYDPIVVGTATVVLVAVVLAAGFFPARRAARVAPMDALRHE